MPPVLCRRNLVHLMPPATHTHTHTDHIAALQCALSGISSNSDRRRPNGDSAARAKIQTVDITKSLQLSSTDCRETRRNFYISDVSCHILRRNLLTPRIGINTPPPRKSRRPSPRLFDRGAFNSSTPKNGQRHPCRKKAVSKTLQLHQFFTEYSGSNYTPEILRISLAKNGAVWDSFVSLGVQAYSMQSVC